MKAMIRWITLCALILVAPIASGMSATWGYAANDTALTATLSVNEGGVYSSTIFSLVFVDGATGTYTATATTDPGFASFVSYLQNGVNGTVTLTLTGTSSGRTGSLSGIETAVFSFPLPENITGITMTVNQLAIASPGDDWNGDGVWTDVHMDVSLTAVPEPSSFFLLVVGLSAIGLRRSLKRK